MRSDVVWVVIGIASYAAVAPFMLRWLERHGYIDLSWPEPRRTDDGTGGEPGAHPRTGSDESSVELRRIRTKEDGQ